MANRSTVETCSWKVSTGIRYNFRKDIQGHRLFVVHKNKQQPFNTNTVQLILTASVWGRTFKKRERLSGSGVVLGWVQTDKYVPSCPRASRSSTNLTGCVSSKKGHEQRQWISMFHSHSFWCLRGRTCSHTFVETVWGNFKRPSGLS